MSNKNKEILYAISPMLIIGLFSLSIILLKIFIETT